MGSKYVVTAAHCTDGQSASGLKVRVGDTSLDEEFEATSFTVAVKTIKQHSQYNSGTLQNDISVLELDSEVDLYTHPNIKPACLPPRGFQESQLGNTSLYAVGWGKTNNLANISPVLNQLDVKLISNSEVR